MNISTFVSQTYFALHISLRKKLVFRLNRADVAALLVTDSAWFLNTVCVCLPLFLALPLSLCVGVPYFMHFNHKTQHNLNMLIGCGNLVARQQPKTRNRPGAALVAQLGACLRDVGAGNVSQCFTALCHAH